VRGTLSCPAPRPDFAAVRCPGSDGHGPLTLERALAQSCNGYFAQLGAAVGPAALIATAAALGLGQGAGRLPDRADAAAAIGTHGGGARLSARQQAQLLRAVARGALASGAPLPGQALLPRVRDGLRRAVIEGTAQGVAGPAEKVAIAGKTGTAVAGAGKIGWFAGYAPAADPSVVIVVGQRGITGREAAQAARALFSAYFYGRAPNPR
jgi:cell division protein FtsI/penicillin-binding protein 2